jgi:hypothetical protein
MSESKRRHAVLQTGQFVGDIERQQVAPGRQDLPELDKDRPQALQRLAQAHAPWCIQPAPDRHHGPAGAARAFWKLFRNSSSRPYRNTTQMMNAPRTSRVMALHRRHRAPRTSAPANWRKTSAMRRANCPSVGRRIADDTGQIILHIPTHMVDQPVHVGRQLHVALDPDRRLVATQQGLRDHRRRSA